MVPNDDTYCEIDPNVVDRFGIPVLRFHFRWSDRERKQAKHMQETFRRIITEMGGTPTSDMPAEDEDYGLEAGGRIIHESRSHADGEGSGGVGPERVLPGARSQERVRVRWRTVRVAGRQERDVDHPRARDADRASTSRSSGRGAASRVMADLEAQRAQALGAVPVAAGFTWTAAEAESGPAARRRGPDGGGRREEAVRAEVLHPARMGDRRVLVDLIIPERRAFRAAPPTRACRVHRLHHARTRRDRRDRAGAASRQPCAADCAGSTRIPATVRRRRFSTARTGRASRALLDAIAWPERAKDNPALSQGVAFFSSFRDLTASGFWSSKMGVEDLKYMGNVPNPSGMAVRRKRSASWGSSCVIMRLL